MVEYENSDPSKSPKSTTTTTTTIKKMIVSSNSEKCLKHTENNYNSTTTNDVFSFFELNLEDLAIIDYIESFGVSCCKSPEEQVYIRFCRDSNKFVSSRISES